MCYDLLQELKLAASAEPKLQDTSSSKDTRGVCDLQVELKPSAGVKTEERAASSNQHNSRHIKLGIIYDSPKI